MSSPAPGPTDEIDLEKLDPYRSKPGAPYTVVLGSGPPKRGFIGEMLSSSTWVPAVDFGPDCVCCNQPAVTEVPLRGDAYGDYYGGNTYAARVCDDCLAHAVAGTLAPHMATVSMGIGGSLLLFAIWLGLGFALVGAAMIAVGGSFFLARDTLVRRRVARGHHAGLELHITDGYVTVFTHNPRLAADLLDRYAEIAGPPRRQTGKKT